LGQSDSTIEADTKLVIAPDPHQEIRQVVRSIIKKAETGIPFHRMAIVYRQRDPYARLVKEELEMAGLPVAGPNPDTFSDTAVGRTLTRLMELAEQGDLPRDTVMAWLADCPVRPPGIPKGQYSPSLWDTVSKKAGVVRGLDQWTERLTQFAISSMRSAARAELLGDISEEQAAQVRSEAEVARHVLEFVQDLGDHVPPPHDGSSWGDFGRWADGLLNRYLVAEADLPDSELSSLLGIKDKLGEMVAIDYLQPRPTQRVFREAVCEALQAGLGHMGATGKGVFVAPFGSVATMSFDTVYLVGMIEGAVPPPTADDPLVPDRNRREAEGSSAGLTLQEARKADERFAYLAALATAPNRVLSFPKADTAAQRGFYPSRWFLEQASSLAGEPVYTSTIWSLADKPWLTVIPSFEGGLMVAEEQSLADPYDYKLARLWSWRQAGLRVADHPLAKSEPLRRALTLGRLRNMGRVTEWDGDVSAASTKSNRLSSVSAPIHSSSSLERWARCPFSYYLGNVLGLGAVERPEEILSITALNKGVLIHDILETFFNTVLQKGSVPRPGEDWTDGHLEALIRIAEEAFTEAQVTGQTGKRLLWEMEKADIVADLEAFLVEDSRLRERFNVTPQSVEARFGFGEDSWEASEVELSDGRTIRFRGMIDRVDIDESGRRALVTDYKTGSITPYSGLNQDPLDGGRKLQLPIYSLATRQQMGNDVVVSAAYWFISSRSKFGLRPAAPVEIDDVSDRFKDVVAEITKGIGSGMFPANPGPRSYFGGFENCAFCEFDRICPTRRDVVWERKSADPRLAGYLGISESGEPEI
jgi:RecB family exonuclease